MPEIQVITLNHRELVEAMIRYQNLHEGIWQLHIEFGIGGANVITGDGNIVPTALVPVNKMGLTKVDKEGPIALDASKINPAPPKSKKKEKAK